MEDIWNITALVVSVLSVLLSLYALRQATTKNTSDMYLFFISQYAKEDMKLALRKLKDIKRGVYRLEQWESDMKNNLPKAFEYDEARRLVKYFYDTLYEVGETNRGSFCKIDLLEERGMALSGHSRSHGKIF